VPILLLLAVLWLAAAPASSTAHARVDRTGFDNRQWVIAKGDGSGIPEMPFEARVDGTSIGRTSLLTFASRVTGTSRFPQVLVIASSGYLRIKSGADPSPPLPFGQSLVLGPAIFASSAGFPSSTLFFNPQVQRVDVGTGKLHRNGTGTLSIRIVARDSDLPTTSTNTNQIMDLSWNLALDEPSEAQTRLDVDERYRFTERAIPDPIRTAELQSFRLFQVSSMFIDAARHDVDALRYRSSGGPVEIHYSPPQANSLLPASPSPLAGGSRLVDSIHTDDVGQPNGNTPSYRFRVQRATGPLSGPLTPRAFFNDGQDLNDDNLGLWLYRRPADAIDVGAGGRIGFSVLASTDPLPSP